MSLDVKLKDGTGGAGIAKVTASNELVTGPLSPSTPTNVITINSTGTAFNLQIPITGRKFRLTEIVMSSDKNVSVNGAIVEIYEADDISTTVQSKKVLEINLNRQDRFALTGINWEISEGVWLTGESDQANVTVTVAGYYVNV